MSTELPRYDQFGKRAIQLGLMVAILALLVFPFLVMLSTALKTRDEIASVPPTWIPVQPAPLNFWAVWDEVPLLRYFINSVVIAGGAMTLNAVAAIPAGFALARLRFPGRTAILLLVIATQMFTPMI